MIVNSYNPEFGYELISVIPYAYYHRDRLKQTISAIGTSPYYWFSPSHVEHSGPRSWYNVQKIA